MDGNATPHRANIVNRYLEADILKKMEEPLKSPDHYHQQRNHAPFNTHTQKTISLLLIYLSSSLLCKTCLYIDLCSQNLMYCMMMTLLLLLLLIMMIVFFFIKTCDCHYIECKELNFLRSVSYL